MGELLERIKLSNLVNGDGITDVYKNNSFYFLEKYQKSDNDVQSVQLSKIEPGRFYFFHYLDDSNWMKYSPVFTVSMKQFETLKIVFAINLNFIPIEVRTSIFDNVFVEENFTGDIPLKVDYQQVYNELMSYGFEYSICEYNLQQIKLCHKINMELTPRFIYAGHPKNKYDPKKLYSIWKTKLTTRNERDSEMSKIIMKDLFDLTDDVSENYKQLQGHIQRLKQSLSKYGR